MMMSSPLVLSEEQRSRARSTRTAGVAAVSDPQAARWSLFLLLRLRRNSLSLELVIMMRGRSWTWLSMTRTIRSA
jgi:hypothetical protein